MLSSAHKSKEILALLTNFISVLNWPPYNPDVNHDVNLWAIFKAKVTKPSPKNLAQLEEVVYNVWQNDVELKILCRSMVYSMPDRIGAIMKSRCGFTKYEFCFFDLSIILWSTTGKWEVRQFKRLYTDTKLQLFKVPLIFPPVK